MATTSKPRIVIRRLIPYRTSAYRICREVDGVAKLLNFTIYFEKTNRIKRIFVHSAWCDYNCINCSQKTLCDRIHDAIVAAEEIAVKQVVEQEMERKEKRRKEVKNAR